MSPQFLVLFGFLVWGGSCHFGNQFEPSRIRYDDGFLVGLSLFPSMDFIPIGFLSFNKYLLPLPACRSSPSFKLLLLLLLAGDVNVNPGPTIGLVNARSVRNKVPAIEELISSNKLLCLGLTETWLTASETSSFLSELTPDGFDFLHKPCSGRGGGVGLIARKDLFPSVVEFPSFNTLEVLGCRVRFGKKLSTLLLCTDLRIHLILSA